MKKSLVIGIHELYLEACVKFTAVLMSDDLTGMVEAQILPRSEGYRKLLPMYYNRPSVQFFRLFIDWENEKVVIRPVFSQPVEGDADRDDWWFDL